MEKKEMTWWDFFFGFIKIILMIRLWPLTIIYIVIKNLSRDD